MIMKKRTKHVKVQPENKLVGIAGNVGAAGSVVSAHNVCHVLCLGAVALLSVFGVIIASDALMWLEAFAWPFWIMGVAFLALSLALYAKYGPCISRKAILANAGLIVIGAPFAQSMQWLVWAPGVALTGFALLWFFYSGIEGEYY